MYKIRASLIQHLLTTACAMTWHMHVLYYTLYYNNIITVEEQSTVQYINVMHAAATMYTVHVEQVE